MNTLDSLLKEYCILCNRSLSHWTDIYRSMAFVHFCAESLCTTVQALQDSRVFKEWLSDKDEDAYFLYGIMGA